MFGGEKGNDIHPNPYNERKPNYERAQGSIDKNETPVINVIFRS